LRVPRNLALNIDKKGNIGNGISIARAGTKKNSGDFRVAQACRPNSLLLFVFAPLGTAQLCAQGATFITGIVTALSVAVSPRAAVMFGNPHSGQARIEPQR
jgi:hypothetical protein